MPKSTLLHFWRPYPIPSCYETKEKCTFGRSPLAQPFACISFCALCIPLFFSERENRYHYIRIWVSCWSIVMCQNPNSRHPLKNEKASSWRQMKEIKNNQHQSTGNYSISYRKNPLIPCATAPRRSASTLDHRFAPNLLGEVVAVGVERFEDGSSGDP